MKSTVQNVSKDQPKQPQKNQKDDQSKQKPGKSK
jgi:hypothetical protein